MRSGSLRCSTAASVKSADCGNEGTDTMRRCAWRCGDGQTKPKRIPSKCDDTRPGEGGAGKDSHGKPGWQTGLTGTPAKLC